MKRPLSTTPTTRLRRSSSRAGSAIGPKLQSRIRLPLSVTKGWPADDRRSGALAPRPSRAAQVCFQPEGDDLDGNRCARAQPIHQLGPVHDDRQAPASGGDDLLAQQRSAQSLNQIERAAFHLVRAVDREIDLPMLGERSERNARGRRLRCRALRGCDADEAQASPMTPSERLTANAAVEPVPSPTTMPSWTSSTAAAAAARLSAFRSAPDSEAAALMTGPPPQWRWRGWPQSPLRILSAEK